MGMLEGDAVAILIDAVLYNFYAMSALAVTFLSIYFSIDIGAMKDAKYTTSSHLNVSENSASMYYMLIPILLMVIFVFIYLYITGDGDMLKGSGSSSVFYAILSTLIFMLFYYVGTKNMGLIQWSKSAWSGAKKFFSIGLILLFAFSIGSVTSELKTGFYLASFANENLSIYLLASVIFLLSAVMAFATGTSWGTFSIMVPVAIPMAIGMDADVALCIGAVISGGVFGDHCSPISDTTIISSMAAECELIEHVKTQLPYAFISAFLALVLFTGFSFYLYL